AAGDGTAGAAAGGPSAGGAAGDGTAGAAAGGPTAGGDGPTTVEEAVTEPLVASVGTRFAVPGVAGGDPVQGRVVLGQNELLLVTPADADRLDGDAAYALVELDAMVDVVPDAEPDGASMGSTVGVAWRGPDGTEVAAVELEGARKRDFRMALFRNALHVSRMDVTHPAQVGGRVTDESATPGMLYLDCARVRFTPIGSDATMVAIALDEVLHVERTRQRVGDGRQPALAIQQFDEDRAVTTVVGSDSVRTLSLFERFVRRDYRERLREARSLSIPDREKEVLVALYSAGAGVDLTDVFARAEGELRELVESLRSKGLVTADDLSNTRLTAKGRLVVSDRLDEINE
ncbi:MAG: CheF family chemotaxis protein, partial [Haloarculaceae archaeon]